MEPLDSKTKKFNFTDEEFIAALNVLFKADSTHPDDFVPITSIDEELSMGRLDSLSMIVFFMWISELFGIPESKLEEFAKNRDFKVSTLRDFVKAECTRSYTLADVEEYSKRCL